MAAPMKCANIEMDAKDVIKSKTKSFIENKKNSNNLIDIVSFSETNDPGVLLSCIRSFHRIFVHLISSQDICFEKPSEKVQDVNEMTKNDQYKEWLRTRYDDVKSRLLNLFLHENSNVQELALDTLMKFIEAEGHQPLRKITESHLYFPAHIFEPVLCSMLSEFQDMTSLIAKFQGYLVYDDVRYYSMRFSLKDVKERREHGNDVDVYKQNLFHLIEKLGMPAAPKGETLQHFIAKPPNEQEHLKINTYKEHKKLFTSLWLEFLKLKLTTGLYKKVLLGLHENVMPYFTSPLLLSDFLTESYNIGGAISLLALNGLFILVNSYNLEYPDFYQKLYALFEPSMFHVKYRARFFFLADLFLTSTHLPAYLVAAFVKRLARLSLTTTVSGQVILLPFIYNLLIRHPSCQVLVHNPAALTDVKSDPYKMEEKDPAKCNAFDSSLWEIKSLQSHYHHRVATEAKRLDQPLPKQEFDMASLLETTVDEILETEMKKKVKEVPTNFDRPVGIFSQKDGVLNNLWTLS